MSQASTLTDSPEYWWNGHNYIRPFVAEIECHFDVEPYRAKFGHEWMIPASMFPKCRVTRVIPTDEWFGEVFGNTYTTDEKRPKGYRYDGDVRQWSMDQARGVSNQVSSWAKSAHRGKWAR